MQWHGLHIRRQQGAWEHHAEDLKRALRHRVVPRMVAPLLTCNRVALVTSDAAGAAWARKLLDGVDHESYRDREAARMLFRVAAGLDSTEVGDKHVRVQLGRAANECSCQELQNAIRTAVNNAGDLDAARADMKGLDRIRSGRNIVGQLCDGLGVQEVLQLAPATRHPLYFDDLGQANICTVPSNRCMPFVLAGTDLVVVQGRAHHLASQALGKARYVLDFSGQLDPNERAALAREDLTALMISLMRESTLIRRERVLAFHGACEGAVLAAADAFYDVHWQWTRQDRYLRTAMALAAHKSGMNAREIRCFMHDCREFLRDIRETQGRC